MGFDAHNVTLVDPTDCPVGVSTNPLCVTGVVVLGGVTGPTTGTCSAAAMSGTAAVVLAANVNRKGFWIYNPSSVNVYLRAGAGATTVPGGYTIVVAKNGGSWWDTLGAYTGILTGITAGAAATLAVTEYT